MRSGLAGLLSIGLLLSACGGGDGGGQATPTASPPETTTPMPALSLDESIELPGFGYSLRINCYGEGAPTTILEAGSADDGIESFASFFLKALAAEGTACTYDRLGTGQSDRPEPGVRRTLRNQVDELHALLTETGLPTPYVLAGSSWGGFVVMDYAAVYPDDVGALVLLDVPAPSATLTEEDIGGSWNSPGNPELVDALEAEHRLAEHPPQVPPVQLRVVTASFGQSSVENQSFWMELSPESVSTLLEGGHVIHEADASGVIEEILQAIASATG